MQIVKTFKSDIDMTIWLTDKTNLDALKKEYPVTEYRANLNLIDKQVEVTEKEYIIDRQ